MATGTAVATLQPRLSITESLARHYGMMPQAFEQTLRRTVVPKECTREEFAAFLLVAKNYGLNPILKEIYAFPKKGGGIQPIVGVDGWSAMINRHPQFDGMTFVDSIEDGRVVAITCRIHRKDRSHPIEATEYLSECARGGDVWAKWPRRMLRHKAMIQAARYAFGFSGIVDPDEIDRFGAVQHDPAMLRAQMQIADGTADVDVIDGDALTVQTRAGEEDQRPAAEIAADADLDEIDDAAEAEPDEPPINPNDKDYKRGFDDARMGRHKCLKTEIVDNPARLAAWQAGALAGMAEG